MSKQDAKNLFKDGETTWEEKTMHEYTDIVYDEISRVENKPKDYIIDRGSNANGVWERWASGKQVCTHVLPIPSGQGTSWGSLYYIYTNPRNWEFPKPFINSEISITGQAVAFAGFLAVSSLRTSSANGIHIVRPVSSFGNTDTVVPITAIGKWK